MGPVTRPIPLTTGSRDPLVSRGALVALDKGMYYIQPGPNPSDGVGG